MDRRDKTSDLRRSISSVANRMKESEVKIERLKGLEHAKSLAVKESMTELVKWFEVVTQQTASQDSAAFANVDLHLAIDQIDRMQFMIENGLGPSDMKDSIE